MNALPYGEKNYDDMLSRFHLIPKRNRRTDRRTELLYQYRASVCWRAIKSNETISLKLDAVTGPTNRKNGLTFGGDTDSGSLFHFHHHCGIADSRRFISISHTVTGRFLRNLAQRLTPNPQTVTAIRQTAGSALIRSWIPDHFGLGGCSLVLVHF